MRVLYRRALFWSLSVWPALPMVIDSMLCIKWINPPHNDSHCRDEGESFKCWLDIKATNLPAVVQID